MKYSKQSFGQFYCLKPVYDSFGHLGCLKPVDDKTVYTAVYTTPYLKLPALPKSAIGGGGYADYYQVLCVGRVQGEVV